MAGETHYEVLGVSQSADDQTLRRAYLAQAWTYHPDFHSDDAAAPRLFAEERMRAINDAWYVLGDRRRREKYDRDLRLRGTPTPGVRAAYAAHGGHGGHGGDFANGWADDDDFDGGEGSGTALPRWLTVAPALSLVLAVGAFSVGLVTGLAGILAAGLGLALLGAALFLIVPMVALNRSKRG